MLAAVAGAEDAVFEGGGEESAVAGEVGRDGQGGDEGTTAGVVRAAVSSREA